jgi:hypothetical protein
MAAPNVSCVFDWIFPWLEYSYLDTPIDDNGEVVEHIFEVGLNALGKAFLIIDDYYRDGATPSPHIEITEPTGETWDEEAFAQYQAEKERYEDYEREAYERWRNDDQNAKLA